MKICDELGDPGPQQNKNLEIQGPIINNLKIQGPNKKEQQIKTKM